MPYRKSFSLECFWKVTHPSKFGACAGCVFREGGEKRTVAFRCSDTINYFWGHFTLNLLLLFLIINMMTNRPTPTSSGHHQQGITPRSFTHSLTLSPPSHLPSLPPSHCPPPPPLPPSLIEEVHSKGGGIKVRFEVLAQHCLVLRMQHIRLECGHVSQVHNKSMGIALRIRAESARWTCNYVSS